MINLNEDLIKAQRVKPDCVERIKEIHAELDKVKSEPLSYGAVSEVVDLVEGYEYALQALWNFPINSDYHTHWMQIKGCKCPEMDNLDRCGSPQRIINESCPFHGKGTINDHDNS